VPESYDSLLGKVIAWAPTRTEAAARLAGALDRTYCAGIRTNERWLARILAIPAFLEVRHDIAFLQNHGQELRDEAADALESTALAVAALAVNMNQAPSSAARAVALSPWELSDGFTPNLPAHVRTNLKWRGHSHTIETGYARGMPISTTVQQRPVATVSHPVWMEGGFLAVTLQDVRLRARVFSEGIHVHVWLRNVHFDFAVDDPRSIEFSASASRGGLSTPLPGVVAAVAVKTGQVVAAGEVLMVIEAMKMEHTITAPFAGTVQAIHFVRGDRVPEGSELLELTPAD
jgi:3-methylcrotonyl-CoA carboxylase alpha subunit